MKLKSFRRNALVGSLLLSASLLLNLPAWATLEDNLKHMPQGADGVFSVDTTPASWSYFLQKKPFSDIQKSSFWKEMKDDLAKELGIDMDKDLLPMLGTHVSLGIYTDGAAKDEEFPILIAIDTKANAKVSMIFDALKKKAAADKGSKELVETDHKGVKVYALGRPKTSVSDKPHLALSKNTLLMGSQRLVMKAVETAQGTQSMMADAKFPMVYQAFQKDKMWGYVRPSSLPKMLTKIMDDSDAKEIASITDMFKSFSMFDGMGFGVGLDQNGLSFRSVTQFKKSGLEPKLQSYVNQIMMKPANSLGDLANHAPGRPLFFVSMQGLHLLASDAMSMFMPDNKELQEMTQMVTGMAQKALGMNFKTDMLPHLDGRAGLAVFYPDNIKVFDRVPNVVMYLGVKDNARFQAMLQSKLKLNLGFMEDKPGKESEITFPKMPQAKYQGIPLFMANETPLVKGMKKDMGLQPGYAQVGNVWFMGSSMDALKSVIDLHKGAVPSLSKNGNFQAIQKRLAGNGHEMSAVYMDLGKALDVANFFMGEEKEFQAVKQNIGMALRAIAGGSTQQDVNAQGFFTFDIDMDKVNFEAVAKFFGEEEKSSATEKKDSIYGKDDKTEIKKEETIKPEKSDKPEKPKH